MQEKVVLIVDHDVTIRSIAEHLFQRTGAVVCLAANGSEALQWLTQQQPDLIILGSTLPDKNEWEVCQEMRKFTNAPIIFLTSPHHDNDIVHCLDAGADNFLCKPFSAEVLFALARAVIRRKKAAEYLESDYCYQDDYLFISFLERKVAVRGKPVKLSRREFRLLELLVHNANQILTFNQILENIWGCEYKDNPDYVHVYMSHLRQKIEEDPKQPRYLLTEHGTGYRFANKTA